MSRGTKHEVEFMEPRRGEESKETRDEYYLE